MYTWILFDIDDTLISYDRSEEVALEETMTEYAFPPISDRRERYRAINKPLWKALERGELTVKEIKATRFGLFASALGMTLTKKESRACNEFYLSCLGRQAPLLKGAAIVTSLEKQYSLGLLTNGLEKTQQNRMKISGLAGSFTFLLTSEACGFAKPDTRIFERAWELMSRPPREGVLMVGDNTEGDIRGAREYGFKTCWINPEGRTFPHDWRPDYEIKSPGDLAFLREELP